MGVSLPCLYWICLFTAFKIASIAAFDHLNAGMCFFCIDKSQFECDLFLLGDLKAVMAL